MRPLTEFREKTEVQLIGTGPSLLTMGSLNSIMLTEEGYEPGVYVPVVQVLNPSLAKVRLPSGYLLNVNPRDIVDARALHP